MKKTYRVRLRFLSEDYTILERFISDKNVDYELLRKNEPNRPHASTLTRTNVLLTNIIRTDSIEEIEKDIIELILKMDLEHCELSMKKEIIISSINDTDQFGFELSNELLQVIAKNKLTLCVSGVFV